MHKIFFIIFSCIFLYGVSSLIIYEQPIEGDSIINNNFIQHKYISKLDPPCYQMYYYIEKYSKEYNIPKKYMYGIALMETGYRGPLHIKYNHIQESSVGAVGPMQIMKPTAEHILRRTVQRQKLKTDIKLNVEISAKLLNKLYVKYKDWKIVFGCYNTGRPMINLYAIKVFNFKGKEFIKRIPN